MNRVLDITAMQIQRAHYEKLKRLGQLELSRKVQMMTPSKYAEHVGLKIVKHSKISSGEAYEIQSKKYINNILKHLGII